MSINLVEALVEAALEKDLLREAYEITAGLMLAPVRGKAPLYLRKLASTVIGAAAASPAFRQKILEPGFPVEADDKISVTVGYMNSDRQAGQAVTAGFWLADMTAEYMNDCELPAGAKVLDFGCGSLRVGRHLMQFAPGFEYFCCDVNRLAIEWAQREFAGRARPFHMDPAPPLNLKRGSIDFLFA